MPRQGDLIRDSVWEWVGRPGLEHLRLDIGDGLIRAEGRVVVVEYGDIWRRRAPG